MAGKGNNQGNPAQEAKAQQFYDICQSIVPTISEAIDNAGGFCSMGEVSKDPNVIQALQQIPDGFSKKVKNIIDLFPDFISYFEGGRVATAKGYEEGLVNPDGTINKVKKSKTGEPAQTQFTAVAEAKNACPAAAQPREKGEVVAHNFGMMGKLLQEACMHGSDEELAAAFEEARAFRLNHSPAAQEEAKRVLVDCIQRIVESGKKPTLNFLSQREDVVALAPVIGRKVKKFIEEHSDTFIIRKEAHPNNAAHEDLVVDINQSFFSRPPAPRGQNIRNNVGMAKSGQAIKAPLAAPAVQGGKPSNKSQGVAAPQIYRPTNGFVGGKGKGGKGKGNDSAAKRFRAG